ncbi:MAG: LysM peptidoglycan-binding domain-containing protein [Bacteroidetes bacterium]|nr:LysM peptidoglycan-binding domain-containing protein [Bacteroidota bacterium]MBT4337592.1 LysM peptidoglycan-binding domain-containing protein [Bacteroidota bacterium]MBT4970233.1 LysM peptidoglycan-binding domain-containing protein [Bacteroidota bacterium]MBT6836333.1 LysM peptidoglycan-binding domain-containing protein [Bacteroidota bacterium]MBT7824957.1 LysM peptidoglycan-binding domain-containing protein [Bacteroidota bacterium]
MLKMNGKYLLLIGFLITFTIPVFGLKDSVGIKTIEGKQYIIHKVDKGQGLFAISKRYNTTVELIKNANDPIEGLKLNQEILIPITQKEKQSETIIHIVKKGETLYRISKTYNVSVEDIKKWNKLSDNAIKDGDEIKIIKIINAEQIVKNTSEAVKSTETVKEETQKVVPNPNEIIEEGIATYIEDPTISSRKALAIHKKAPIGTVIQVTNLMNGTSVFVKVVGNLDEDDSQSNEIIKLSKYTAKKLKIRDQLTRVRLNYFLE